MKELGMPLKIAIIDDAIESKILKFLVPYYEGDTNVIQCEGTKVVGELSTPRVQLPVNHGTLCTALLIEGLHNRNILDKVQICNISIANENGNNTLQGLIEALEYCSHHKFHMISMSVGVLNLLYAKQLIPLLHHLNNAVIVAATANDFLLTYPAAFQTVIGVKRAVNKMRNLIEVSKEPPDGIELIMSYTKTPILSKIEKEYGLTYEDSNSILVPQICAEIADYALRSKMKLTKESVLQLFTKSWGFGRNNEYQHSFAGKESSDSIPVVLFQYDITYQNNRYELLQRLQKHFEKEGYSCAILCDFIKVSDFENGWYKIGSKNIKDEIAYYLNLVSDSVLFLLINNNIAWDYCFDMLIEEDMLCNSINNEDVAGLFDRIVTALS